METKAAEVAQDGVCAAFPVAAATGHVLDASGHGVRQRDVVRAGGDDGDLGAVVPQVALARYHRAP